jgi:hypothetical protein
MIETSLRENAKIVITKHGISPTLLLGSLPVGVSPSGIDAKANIIRQHDQLNVKT